MDKNPQYFEGNLQLRDITEEILDFVYDQIDKSDVWVAKEAIFKNGRDIYISSNKFLRNLGKKLQRKFGGEVKETATLHTRSRQTSKDLYRVTLFFRPVKFKVGDIITYRDEEVKITSLGKKVNVRSIKTAKKQMINFKDLA
jgi:NMD protein affecting ribosome stability and mRNA decay